MDAKMAYKDFTDRLKLLIEKRPDLITTTLSNIFTMRLIGNKTHGDLAEVAMAEFINQYMYDFQAEHVGKDLYRAKSKEEDIKILNEITNIEFPISLKAYGDGPLQLSTDKEAIMFPRLEQEKSDLITGGDLKNVLNDPVFSDFEEINILPLIYNEKKKQCNILVFNYIKAKNNTVRIERQDKTTHKRKHPVYKFYDSDGKYVCEIRYGDATANALQRGLWTHTKNGIKYFDSITGGWIDYSHNHILVELFSHALVSSSPSHQKALEKIKEDIEALK